jgi:16S rRNA (guanine527-N7)-methyltransferase
VSDSALIWKEIICSNGLPISDDQFEQLCAYHDLLLEWNKRVNLISRRDEANIWPNHILHSLSLLFMFDIPGNVIAADIGSGGGLPGIPLSVALPGLQLTLVESIRKKCLALEDMASRLGLRNVEIINSRIEEVALQEKERQKFDVVIARAVAPLRELLEWSENLFKTSNRSLFLRGNLKSPDNQIPLPCLIAMKGGDVSGEIVEALGTFRSARIGLYDIDFSGMEKTSLQEKKAVVVSL